MNYKLFVCLCVNNNSIEPTTRNLCRESFLKITMACFKNRKKTIEMKELPTLKEWPRQHNYVCLIEVIGKQRRSSSLMWTPAEGILKKSFIQYKSKVIQLCSQNACVVFFPKSFGPEKGSEIWDNVTQNFKNAPSAWYFDKIDANLAAIPPCWPKIRQ